MNIIDWNNRSSHTPTDDEDKGIERILDIVNGSGETPTEHETKILRKIAELSSFDDFDTEAQLERLTSTRHNRTQKKRMSQVLRWSASAAAVVTLGLIIFNQFGTPKDNAIIRDDSNQIALTHPIPESEDVMVTLRNGLIINAAETFDTSSSTQDLTRVDSKHSQASAISEYNTIVVPKKKTFELYLEDGSLLTFNSDTKVRFPDEFSTLERRIIVDYGEVFVEVVKDTARPFIVEVGGSEIEVLGTSFNIQAYPETPLSTTLVTGRVKFSKGEKSVQITPGKQVTVANGDELLVKTVNTENITAWTRGHFVFENKRLSEIVSQIERWYDIRIVFDNPELYEYRFTGIVNKTDELYYFINLLSMTTMIDHYCDENSTIHLRSRR